MLTFKSYNKDSNCGMLKNIKNLDNSIQQHLISNASNAAPNYTLNYTSLHLKNNKLSVIFSLIFNLIMLLVIFYSWEFNLHVYYFYIVKRLLVIIILISSLDLMLDLLVTPNYLVIFNPNYNSSKVEVTTRYKWLFRLKLVMVVISFTLIYINWSNFIIFILGNKIVSFFLLIITLVFLFIFNSGFINYFRSLPSKQYLVQTFPNPFFRIISHKYFKYYILVGIILNAIAANLASTYNFLNVEWVNNIYLDVIYNVSILWIFSNLIINTVRFIYKLYILYNFGTVRVITENSKNNLTAKNKFYSRKNFSTLANRNKDGHRFLNKYKNSLFKREFSFKFNVKEN